VVDAGRLRVVLLLALSVLVTAAIGVAHLSRGDQGPADTAEVAAQEPDVGLSEVDSVASIRPLPRDAPKDRPSFYDDGSGCQIRAGDPVPKVCAAGAGAGDEDATRTVMLVGDSKIGQWHPAFAEIARREKWRLLTSTKSGCAFTDAMMVSQGKEFTDCRDWGTATLEDVLRIKPDVVITSQVHDTALLDGQAADGRRSRGAMIRGLHRYWRALQDAGIQVVVLLDNPMPTTHPAYRCVQDHPDQLSRCSFELAGPLAESAAPMQVEAAKSVPGVTVIDMAPIYCPGQQRCPAVLGDVLVYRSGSHLTKTFVLSAQQQLSAQLHAATHGAFGTAGHRMRSD
jgi:hypothetical protein